MVRVLHVIATLDPAGAERQMVQLVRRLDRDRFEPAVCCLTRGGPLEDDLRQAGVPAQILHKQGKFDLKVISRLTAVMRRFGPQIVHTWLPTSNTLGRVAAISAKVPVIIAAERAADVWKGYGRRMVDRTLTHYTSRVITNAEAVRRFLIERIGLPERKIVVVHNGLDLAEFDALAAQGLTRPVPAKGPALVIGTVGRLEPQKGMPHLLAAFAGVPPEIGPVQLWIAGSGPDEAALREQAEGLGIGARVHFLGRRADVPALMAQFDLLVLPSLWEGLPNVALEAQAARRAVVATSVDGTPEAVRDGVTGALVPPRDAQALARAMAELLRDPARRTQFGEAGRRYVEAEFSMGRMVAETQRIYDQALTEAGA